VKVDPAIEKHCGVCATVAQATAIGRRTAVDDETARARRVDVRASGTRVLTSAPGVRSFSLRG